jgi:hypothetical protein
MTLHLLSQACVFVYSSHEKWFFLPPPLLQAFPLLVVGHVLLLLPSQAGLL